MLILKKTVFIFLLLFGVSTSSYAFLNPIAYANYLQDLKTALNSVTSLTNQARQIQQQIAMIKNQVKNSTTISNYQWQNIQNVMQQMAATSQQAQSISYSVSDLNQRFQKTYPNYSDGHPNTAHYTETTQQWHRTTLATLQQSLQAMHVDAQHFQQENQLMSQLKNQGQTATGRLQALQVLSEMSAENINQLQAMKRVMMTQANAQTAYMAYRVSKDAYQQRMLMTLDQQMPTYASPYHNNSAFGLIPSMR